MSGQSSQGINEFNNTFSQMGLQDLEQLIIREINNQFGGTINIQKFTIQKYIKRCYLRLIHHLYRHYI